MKFTPLFVPLFVAMSTSVLASGPEPGEGPSGNLRSDLLYGFSASPASGQDLLSIVARQRSVPLALALSAALPGAGQVYNKTWIRAGIAAALEAALITGYIVWRGQGKDGEREFQAYAHDYWSPIRYAQWLSGYTGYGGPAIELPSLTEEQFQHPDAWTAAQAQEVRAFFQRIRAAEEQSYHLETNAAFSHVLPFFGEQQYYELIGKYFQYATGWDDYNGANDPEQSAPDGTKVNVPPGSKFFVYDDMSEDANNLLRRASRVSALLIVNHFVAAIDAAVSAKLHNDRIKARIAWRLEPTGEWAPTVGLAWRF